MSETEHQDVGEVTITTGIRSLAMSKENFPREVISNAPDAVDEILCESLIDPSKLDTIQKPLIEIVPDKANNNHAKQEIFASSAASSFTASTPSSPTDSSMSGNDSISHAIKFLNLLDDMTANAFKNEVLEKSDLSHIVNPKNLINITDDKLRMLKGRGEHNGDFFNKWISCYINQRDIENPPTNHPQVNIQDAKKSQKNGYASIQYVKSLLLSQLNVKGVNIYKHHVVLRANTSSLPSLGNSKSSLSGSHLCDSNGCLRSEHLTIELFTSNNLPRKKCCGVILIVLDGSIIHFDPCEHGKNHSDANGDALLFCCRKIRVVTLSREAIMVDNNSVRI